MKQDEKMFFFWVQKKWPEKLWLKRISIRDTEKILLLKQEMVTQILEK